VKVSGQTGVAVPAGRSYLLYNNGTDVVNALNGISPVSGGTGTNTLTAEAVLIGNTTSNVKFVSPGTNGNVLTSNGSAWLSVAAVVPESFASGTVMLFGQTAAPTGWTKDTSNFNNSGLRVVTGTASSGGSVDFTTAFASQTPSGTVSVSGSAGNTTLSTPQIPSHRHTVYVQPPYSQSFPSRTILRVGGGSPWDTPANQTQGGDITPAFENTGGGGAHSHPLSISSASFSGNAINLAVKYVDVIRATKN
jgi:hypothetical protein